MISLSEAKQRIYKISLAAAEVKGKYELLLQQLQDIDNAIATIDTNSDIQRKSIVILDKLSEIKRKELSTKVENLITTALRAVFEESYTFKIVTYSRANQIKMEFKLVHNSVEADILEGHGGGIVDVVSFLLRVINLLMFRPKLRPFILLDEPFKHVSREYLPAIASLLKHLSHTTGVQFLIVTHAPELKEIGDVVYNLSLDDRGYTKFNKEHI